MLPGKPQSNFKVQIRQTSVGTVTVFPNLTYFADVRIAEIQTMLRNQACIGISHYCLGMLTLMSPGTVYPSVYTCGSVGGSEVWEDTGNIWEHSGCDNWGGGCYWHPTRGGQDAAKHPPMHRTTAHDQELCGPKCQWCQGGEALFPVIQNTQLRRHQACQQALPSPLVRVTAGLRAQHIRDCSPGVPPTCKTDCAAGPADSHFACCDLSYFGYNKQIVWKGKCLDSF